MMSVESDHALHARFSVEYRLTGTEPEARARAEALCLEQTVEMPDEFLPSGPLREQILGRVESFQPLTGSTHEAVMSFPSELVGDDFTQLLQVVFGIASLTPGLRVHRLHLPEAMLTRWPGPRHGCAGLRDLVGTHDRPLVCGVLKPLGLPARDLATLAYQFARGGLDLIKDDQGLADHSFCRFEDRVSQCAAAVARANRETGGRCRYLPHVTGPWDTMRRRCLFAKRVGAGGVVVCPGLTGFDAVRDIAQDDDVGLPIVTHPNFLGSYVVHETGGIAPAVLFGQLPRLAGADASIYPSYGSGFPMTPVDCRAVGAAATEAWGHLHPMFPTAAGRMSLDRVREVGDFYSGDVIIIVGAECARPGHDVVETCRSFIQEASRCGTR